MRDALAGGALLAVLYLPFSHGGTLPLGTIPSVIATSGSTVRCSARRAAGGTSAASAAVAVRSGCSRRRGRAGGGATDEPAAWAWPMAIALAGAPGHLSVVPAVFHAVPASRARRCPLIVIRRTSSGLVSTTAPGAPCRVAVMIVDARLPRRRCDAVRVPRIRRCPNPPNRWTASEPVAREPRRTPSLVTGGIPPSALAIPPTTPR